MTNAAIEPAAAPVEITCDGATIAALPGETVAAALTAAGLRCGLFCGMGACFGCQVSIDDVPGQRACLAKVRPGMRISRGPAMPRAGAPMATTVETPRHSPVLVVGAGPAGLAAALAVARRGLAVTVLDERDAPGGQFYKPLSDSQRHTSVPDRQAAAGLALTASVHAAGVAVVVGATIWHAEPRTPSGAVLQVVRDGGHECWTADRLIVATGAIERAWMVPGWTLPGVMTTGAAQTLARSNRVAPGRRILIAGNGPLNLQLAAELLAAGVPVVALAEAAAPPWHSLRAAARMTRHAPRLVAQGARQLWRLRQAGVPVLHNHVLMAIEGRDHVEFAVLVRLGRDGSVIPGSQHRVEVDTVCLGYGFAPANELTRLLGCRHDATPNGDALAVWCDGERRTSLPGIYVAGDAGRPLGAQAALAAGELAGLAAAADQGVGDDAQSRARVQRRIRRATAFQSALWQVYQSGASTASYATAATVLCRCEAVTFGCVQSALDQGVSRRIGPVKRATRCGMGPCQGRYCGPVLAQLLGNAETPPERHGFAPQAPLRPVPIGAIATAIPWAQGEPITLPRPLASTDAPAETIATADYAVIGGGIIGVCAAYALACEGADVMLIERAEPNGEASGGNAGSLHVQLLSYAFADLDSAVARATLPALRLCRDAARAWETLAGTIGADIELRRPGGVSVADTPESVRRLHQKVALERMAGIDVDVLTGDEVRAVVPALSPAVLAAAFSRDEGKLNPQRAGPAVLAAAARKGLRVLARAAVLAIEPEHGAYRLHTERGIVRAGRVLNAAGAWAPQIAGMLGITLPIRATPLQMLVSEALPPMLDHLVAHCTERLTVKQASRGNIIIGGGWQARLDTGTRRTMPTVEALRGNLGVAYRTLPMLRDVRIIRTWTAMNVGTVGPPIISATAAHPRFFHVATANGLTMAPVVGRICADLLLGRDPQYDVTPFDLDRAR